jgi:hypothetical protein
MMENCAWPYYFGSSRDCHLVVRDTQENEILNVNYKYTKMRFDFAIA